MRTPLLAANWKMNTNRREARNLVEDLLSATASTKGREVWIAPPFQLLSEVGGLISGRSHYMLGGQNLHWAASGAYTGEVSAPMLKDVGCGFVIIGHSERRAYFGETEDTCHKKVGAALSEGLIPCLCVGETLAEREAGKTRERVATQLTGALKGHNFPGGDRLVIAYEPVWAIGSGKTDSPPEANETMGFLRTQVSDLFGERVAAQTRILYGGSVKPENIDGFMAMPHIDGALVGGASLKADSFARIVQFQVAEEVSR